MNNKTSIIWQIPHDELQVIIDSSHSIVQILETLKLNGRNGNHRTLKKRFDEEKFNFTKLKENKKREHSQRSRKKPDKEVFCENSTYLSNDSIKARLIKDYNWSYKCSECNTGNTYNNKPLSLQLDHINGINNDNRFENLRFLCPNCHSQTKTFSGKNTKTTNDWALEKREKTFCRCGKEKTFDAKVCKGCHNEERPSEINWPDNNTLSNLVSSFPMVKVAEKIGCSDNAVRKRCKKMNIEF